MEGSGQMSRAQSLYVPPDWAFEFHGHRCPFMPLGYRMGLLALEALGTTREMDHALHVICELGEGHPQTCLMDGIQVATGASTLEPELIGCGSGDVPGRGHE
jgi:formylmethanofuran dehydrogenase subunit E